MIKLIYRTLITVLLILLILIAYLSTIGIKTNKFNPKIISKIKAIDPNIELKINDVNAKLNLFNLGVSLKTIGTNVIYRDKTIKLESIKTNISVKSFLQNKFPLTEISISTKSLAIKNLIYFVRLFNNNTRLFFAEQFIKNGYVVADLKLEFDELGNIKDNFKLNGILKDGRISLLKRYNFNKIDLIFKVEEKNLKFEDVKFLLNNNSILLPEADILKRNSDYFISGKLNNKNIDLKKTDITQFLEKDFLGLNIQEITFNSKNDFEFKITQDFKIKNFNLKSEINLDKLKLKNSLKLKNIFPNVNKEVIFKNQKIKLEYNKDTLGIVGNGDVLLQKEIDKIKYEILKKKDEVKIITTLNITNNPFTIGLINYQKNKKSNLELSLKAKKKIKSKLIFNEIFLKENKNEISLKNVVFTNNYKLEDIENINIDYFDKENLSNKLQLSKINQDYLVSGSSFNVNNLINNILNSKEENKLKLFNKNFKLIFNIKNIYLDKVNTINDLEGHISLLDNKVNDLNLKSKFPNKKKINFTIKTNNTEKITTLYSQEAKPLVSRYKFIKGFEEGDLDFYSIKKNNITNSTLKIDNFKIQEIPILAKLLTLASLQGIADLLTGEGIRFTDFEMKFSNKDKLMTIQEMYAIGPAISILMDGYIESDKLISLRGTLVPATTINRTISSIPIIGNILVGKKVGEGVFGVSFKVKGPPKNPETTVNPIKTLTPRFITRTLEKIKKN